MGLLLRRRTMIPITNTPAPLPAGCIFYAPLANNTGIYDQVSGTIAAADTDGTAIWNGNENKYLFTATGAKNSAVYFPLSTPIINLYNEDCTIVFDAKEVSTNGNNWFGALKIGKYDFNTYPSQLYTAHIFYSYSSSPLTTYSRFASCWTAATGKVTSYLNGVVTDSDRTRTISTGIVDCVNFCFLPSNNSYYSLYLKDVYIFNRILTTSEIMAL